MRGLNTYYKSASPERVQEVKRKSDDVGEIMATFQEAMKVMVDKVNALKQRRNTFAKYKSGCALPACLSFLGFASETMLAGMLSFCSPDKIATLPVIGNFLTTHTSVPVTGGFFIGAPPSSSVAGIVPGSIGTVGCAAVGCLACTGLTCWEARRYSKQCSALRRRIQTQEKKLGIMDSSQSSSDVWPKIEDLCEAMKNLLQTLSKMSKMDDDMTSMWNPVKRFTTDTLFLGEEIHDFIKKHGERATQEHLANNGHDELKNKLKEVEEAVRHGRVDTQAPLVRPSHGLFSCMG
jgi:hypothetical protein